jgi:D-arabinose 5-phosphate isomerase GutQ
MQKWRQRIGFWFWRRREIIVSGEGRSGTTAMEMVGDVYFFA